MLSIDQHPISHLIAAFAQLIASLRTFAGHRKTVGSCSPLYVCTFMSEYPHAFNVTALKLRWNLIPPLEKYDVESKYFNFSTRWTIKISEQISWIPFTHNGIPLCFQTKEAKRSSPTLFLSLSESFGSDKQTELRKLHATRFIRRNRIKLNRERRVYS